MPPGVLHHVLIRGIERRRIFNDNEDRENLIERLSNPITSHINSSSNAELSIFTSRDAPKVLWGDLFIDIQAKTLLCSISKSNFYQSYQLASVFS